jgi:hypothetical protein
MEIETEDYGGEEFKRQIETLVKDIDSESRLTRFKMRPKYDLPDARAIEWIEQGE